MFACCDDILLASLSPQSNAKPFNPWTHFSCCPQLQSPCFCERPPRSFTTPNHHHPPTIITNHPPLPCPSLVAAQTDGSSLKRPFQEHRNPRLYPTYAQTPSPSIYPFRPAYKSSANRRASRQGRNGCATSGASYPNRVNQLPQRMVQRARRYPSATVRP